MLDSKWADRIRDIEKRLDEWIGKQKADRKWIETNREAINCQAERIDEQYPLVLVPPLTTPETVTLSDLAPDAKEVVEQKARDDRAAPRAKPDSDEEKCFNCKGTGYVDNNECCFICAGAGTLPSEPDSDNIVAAPNDLTTDKWQPDSDEAGDMTKYIGYECEVDIGYDKYVTCVLKEMLPGGWAVVMYSFDESQVALASIRPTEHTKELLALRAENHKNFMDAETYKAEMDRRGTEIERLKGELGSVKSILTSWGPETSA